jgi:branched-chain amino acid transport system substrate-binding protein
MTRHSLRALAWGALALPALACGPVSTSGITLGAAGPWTSAYGTMNKRGIDLAVEEINRSDLLEGRPLRIEARDDSADGTRAANIAEDLVANRNVIAVIGHVNSGAMVAAAKVYDGALPAVSTTATTPDLTGISPWVFRMISSDSVNGLRIARFCRTLGRRRAAILYENDSYGRGLAESFRRNFNGEIVSVDPVGEETTEFEPFIAFFKARKPDVIFFAGTEVSGAALMKTAHDAGFQADFIGGDGWSGIGSYPAAEGAYAAVPFTPTDPRPEAQRFVAAFKAKFGEAPDNAAALAYDATMLLAHAVAAVGPDRVKVRRWLADLDAGSAYRGVVGPVYFQRSGDPMGRNLVVTRVTGGRLVAQAER